MLTNESWTNNLGGGGAQTDVGDQRSQMYVQTCRLVMGDNRERRGKKLEEKT